MMISLWNRLSLSLRLFVAFGATLTIITVVLISLQSNFYLREKTDSITRQELPLQLERLGAEISLLLSPSLQLSKSLASSNFIHHWIRSGMPEDGLPQITQEMAQVNAHLPTALNVFIAANDGERTLYHHYQNGTLNRHPMDPADPDDSWYFNYLKSQQPYELNLDSNDYSGEQLLMFVNYSSVQKHADGTPLAVAGVGIDMQHLAEMIGSYRIGRNGRAALFNDVGEVEVAEDPDLFAGLKDLPQLKDLLNREQLRVQSFHRDGSDYFTGALWLPDLQRYLVVSIPQTDFLGPIYQQLYQSLVIGAVLVVVCLLLLYPLAGTLAKPLLDFQRQLQDITDSLDLSRRISIPRQIDMASLAHKTNDLLTRIDHAMEEVSRSSEKLSDSADRLAHTAGLVDRNNERQQEVSHSMAAAVEEMSSSVAEITSTMEELSASSTQIADHSQSVVDVAELTLNNSRKGVDAMRQLQQRMGDIQADSRQSLEEIMDLGTKSKEISKVMDLINTLADQTKLIAFNAALEASSAGDSGKRFSVVAGEIRRLADSVTDSTREIEQRIQEIQDSISRLVITSEKGAASIQAGMHDSSSTADSLNALLDAAGRTTSAAQQISLSTKQQKTASSQVVVALRDIASASSNNAQSVRHITDISEEMIAMSQRLNELVHEFKLSAATQNDKP